MAQNDQESWPRMTWTRVIKSATINGATQTYGRKSARQDDLLIRRALSKSKASRTARSDFVLH